MSGVAIVLQALVLMVTASTRSPQTGVSNSATLQTKDLSSPVLKGSKTTYFDLLRTLFPDLEVDPAQPGVAVAHTTVPIKHIGEPGDKTVLEGDFEIKDLKVRQVISQGRGLLLSCIDLSAEKANEATPYEGEASVLAVFSLESTIKLLDAMDIKTDRFTDFWGEHPMFRLNPQNDAFVVYSTHWNAGESYNDITVLFVDQGRLKIIASLFTFDTQGCGANIIQTPFFRPLHDTRRKYPNILARVKVKKVEDSQECDRRTRGYTRYYRAIYHWNSTKAQYESGSRQLERLDNFNRQRL